MNTRRASTEKLKQYPCHTENAIQIAFKKAALPIHSKSPIHCKGSNRQPTNQTIKPRDTIHQLSKQRKTITLQWIPSNMGINGNKAANHLEKIRYIWQVGGGGAHHTTSRQSEALSRTELRKRLSKEANITSNNTVRK